MVRFKRTMSKPSLRILIVDDSKFARDLIRGMLIEANFSNIWEAADEEEAIRMINDREPNLVLLDIDLGRAFDGVDLLQQIKTAQPEVKVIMVSALSQKILEEDIISKSADAFLIKPFKKEQLLFSIGLAMGYGV